MSAFTKLLQQTIELTQAHIAPIQPQTLPPDISVQQMTELHLQAKFYQLDQWGEMRTVLLQAPKIQILNIFFFPYPRWDLPVYAMDFVTLGHKPIVAVIDALALLPQAHCAVLLKSILAQAHTDFKHLPQAENMPQWYQECRSGQDFFIRPQNAQDLEQISNAHLQIWQAVMQMLPQAQAAYESQQTAHAQALTAYKKHHCDNVSAWNLLQQKFGNAWTQVFLQNYLFA